MTGIAPPDLSREAMERILAERTARLAGRNTQATADVATVDLLLGIVGQERFAIRATAVAGVIPFPGAVPVPGERGSLLGLVSHRGLVYRVHDLGALLGGTSGAAPGTGFLLILRAAQPRIALWAEQLLSTISLAPSQLEGLAADGEAGGPISGRLMIDTPDAGRSGASLIDIDQLLETLRS